MGAVKMLQGRSWGLAMAASVIAMLPVDCCCCLGLPIGIWGLVALTRADVKQAFQNA